MSLLKFDHYTIRVKNLDRSVSFYRDTLGLPEIENRTRRSHIRWFSIGAGQELHVVENQDEQVRTNIGIHLALRVRDFEGFRKRLEKNNITIYNSKAKPDEITIRADGIRQVYFQDPDGFWIEVNDTPDHTINSTS